MKFTFIIVLLAFSWRLAAQVQPKSDKVNYMRSYEKYKRMQTGGIVMIVAGGILTGVGISNLSNATYTTNQYGQQVLDSQGATGVLLFAAGLGLVGGGVPLTIVGTRKMHFYQRKMDGVTLNFNFKPQQPGLVLTYRF